MPDTTGTTGTTDPRHPVAELYQGEVLGEAMFNRMLDDLTDAGQRLMVTAMLQLETETKARLRPEITRRDLPVREEAAMRADGEAVADSLAGQPWRDKMTRLAAGVGDRYLPRYQELADAADPADAQVTELMVAHEEALLAAIRRAAADDVTGALATLAPHLHYPVAE